MKGVTITKDITQQVLKALTSLTDKQVLVGIPDTEAEREPDPDDPKPISNAVIGYLMEFGSPANNIPERPHLIPGIESIEPQIAKRYRDGARAVLDGKATSLDPTHVAVGLEAVSAVQRKIGQLLVRYDCTHRCRICVDQRRLGRYFDRFRRRSDTQREIFADNLTDVDFNY